MTYSEMYGPAMKIEDQTTADEYLEKCVRYMMTEFNQSREEATTVVKANLGYYAGYYDVETMHRINRLFRTEHPIFGKAVPTAEEAIEAGKKLGKEARGDG